MKNSDFIIREATLKDLPQIVSLLSDDEIGAKRENNVMPLPKTYLEAFKRIQNDTQSQMIVGTINNTVIGYIQMTVIPGLSYRGLSRAQIEDFRIFSNYRGKGYGSLLLQAIEEKAKAQGCRMLQLLVHQSRKSAHRFYTKLGFEQNHFGMRKQI